jgi:hypothetical protein
MNQSRSWIKTNFNPHEAAQVVTVKGSKLLDTFESNDVDKVSSVLLYDGGEDKEGQWCVQRVDSTGGDVSIRFATVTNNPSYTDYTTAWANRLALQFDLFSIAF